MGSKQYDISKFTVLEAYKRVKANGGSAGVDGVSFEKYEADYKNRLYKLWNRMSSGSYFPKPVKAVAIPKKSGGERILGIPTIDDRIAQMVAKINIEPSIEPMFHEDSYGYRPNKSALDAVGKARERCWRYDFVIDLDIRGLFDNIDHELLMKAVVKHVKETWVILYIQRWLKAPFQKEDGEIVPRTAGTPQGGVISPMLANLFMHYAFDEWMRRSFPNCPFERYADDSVIHCRSEKQAEYVLSKLNERMRECKLELHPTKTKIVYCKDKSRTFDYDCTEFDFLGYTFKRVRMKDRNGRVYPNFVASMSKASGKAMRDKVKALELHKMTGSKIEMVAQVLNPMVRGWMNYFSRYNKSAMKYTIEVIQRRIVKWAMCKYKRFRGHMQRAIDWLKTIRRREPTMFAHWTLFGYCE